MLIGPPEKADGPIQQGEHEYIRKRSYVRYDLTDFRYLPRLESGLKSHDIILMEDASKNLFDRLIAGIIQSGKVARDIKNYFI